MEVLSFALQCLGTCFYCLVLWFFSWKKVNWSLYFNNDVFFFRDVYLWACHCIRQASALSAVTWLQGRKKGMNLGGIPTLQKYLRILNSQRSARPAVVGSLREFSNMSERCFLLYTWTCWNISLFFFPLHYTWLQLNFLFGFWVK